MFGIAKSVIIIMVVASLSACSLPFLKKAPPEASGAEYFPPTKEEVAALDQFEEIRATIRVMDLGSITVQLMPEKAPVAVANFIKLAKANFYNGIKFHRVIKGFMIQTGDPNSKDSDSTDDGLGGPGYTFPAEIIPEESVVRGTLAMSSDSASTNNGSQFFIILTESAPWLEGRYTVFGRVTQGFQAADNVAMVPTDGSGRPLSDVVISSIVIDAVDANKWQDKVGEDLKNLEKNPASKNATGTTTQTTPKKNPLFDFGGIK